ncbi:MAG: hypothetical protein FK731_08825, partial [Asgard group archaeon]|nr:hypothetical protein [Asgard group archaeon]
MSAPIGSIEFLVKFDTMSTSFRKALEDALKGMPVGGTTEEGEGGGLFPTQKLQDLEDQLGIIRFNLETRARAPLGGDWAKFMLTQRLSEITYAKTEEAKEKTLASIRYSPTGKRYFGQREDETEEEWLERTEKLSELALKKYEENLEKAGDQAFYERIRRKLPQWQAFLQAATEGDREQFLKFFIEQLIPETFLEEQLRTRLGKALIEIGAGQKRAYRIKIPLGEEEEEELTRANIYDVLSKKFTIEELKELLYGDVSVKIEDEDIINKVLEILEEYKLPELEVYYPQRFLNIIEELIKSGDITLSEELQQAFDDANQRIYTRTGPNEFIKWDVMQGIKEEFSEKVEEV